MIQPRYSVLQTLFADRVFRIPHYQRFYSWRARQRKDLFSDLDRLALQEGNKHHFMAMLVCFQTTNTKSVGTKLYTIYDIVDGQQRLTTLIILLKCIELAMVSGSEDRKELSQILVKRDGNLILLQTDNANQRLFKKFIQDGVDPAGNDIKTRADENLAKAIIECNEFVATWTAKTKLPELLSLVLHRLGFVVLDTEDPQAVYTVFEVLNSRGLAVDWLDKCKTLLMGKAYELGKSPEACNEAILSLQSIWGDIYRGLARTRKAVDGEEILRVTTTLFYGTSPAKPRSAEESMDLVRTRATTSKEPERISEQLLEISKKLTELHENKFLGPVTEILHARILAVAIMLAKGVSEPERKKLLDQWERVTFRIFGLCGRDARTRVGDYVRLASKIVQQDLQTRTFNEIMTGLKALGADFSFAQAVKDGLHNRDWYSDSADTCRYVLWKYEEHLAQIDGRAARVNEHDKVEIWEMEAVDSVEHVFPQSPAAGPAWQGKMARPGESEQPVSEHVGRIGNLVLLPIKVNQQANNKPFADKKLVYKQHALRMIREVCAESDWTLAEIEAREQRILDWAEKQWADL